MFDVPVFCECCPADDSSFSYVVVVASATRALTSTRSALVVAPIPGGYSIIFLFSAFLTVPFRSPPNRALPPFSCFVRYGHNVPWTSPLPSKGLGTVFTFFLGVSATRRGYQAFFPLSCGVLGFREENLNLSVSFLPCET